MRKPSRITILKSFASCRVKMAVRYCKARFSRWSDSRCIFKGDRALWSHWKTAQLRWSCSTLSAWFRCSKWSKRPSVTTWSAHSTWSTSTWASWRRCRNLKSNNHRLRIQEKRKRRKSNNRQIWWWLKQKACSSRCATHLSSLRWSSKTYLMLA